MTTETNSLTLASTKDDASLTTTTTTTTPAPVKSTLAKEEQEAKKDLGVGKVEPVEMTSPVAGAEGEKAAADGGNGDGVGRERFLCGVIEGWYEARSINTLIELLIDRLIVQ